MSTIDALIQRVREFAAANDLRPSALATMAGLHANSLRSMAEDDWQPNSTTLKKLEAVMDRQEAAE